MIGKCENVGISAKLGRDGTDKYDSSDRRDPETHTELVANTHRMLERVRASVIC
jgi:hypothetical protein